VIGIVSTSFLFFFSDTVASWFANANDVHLLEISAHAIKLFCFAYLFRWLGVITQGFLSAIEKPAFATVMSVSIAFVFPVLLLGALWGFGLDGIWFNFVGVNALAAILAIILLQTVGREIRKKEKAKSMRESNGIVSNS
jgi:Na+-driven multidrug efflux pump